MLGTVERNCLGLLQFTVRSNLSQKIDFCLNCRHGDGRRAWIISWSGGRRKCLGTGFHLIFQSLRVKNRFWPLQVVPPTSHFIDIPDSKNIQTFNMFVLYGRYKIHLFCFAHSKECFRCIHFNRTWAILWEKRKKSSVPKLPLPHPQHQAEGLPDP